MVNRNRGVASPKGPTLALGEAVTEEGRSHLHQLYLDRPSEQGGIYLLLPPHPLPPARSFEPTLGLHRSLGKLTLALTSSLPYRSSQTKADTGQEGGMLEKGGNYRRPGG